MSGYREQEDLYLYYGHLGCFLGEYGRTGGKLIRVFGTFLYTTNHQILLFVFTPTSINIQYSYQK